MTLADCSSMHGHDLLLILGVVVTGLFSLSVAWLTKNRERALERERARREAYALWAAAMYALISYDDITRIATEEADAALGATPSGASRDDVTKTKAEMFAYLRDHVRAKHDMWAGYFRILGIEKDAELAGEALNITRDSMQAVGGPSPVPEPTRSQLLERARNLIRKLSSPS